MGETLSGLQKLDKVLKKHSWIERSHETGSLVRVMRPDMDRLEDVLLGAASGNESWERAAREFARFCGVTVPVPDENGEF